MLKILNQVMALCIYTFYVGIVAVCFASLLWAVSSIIYSVGALEWVNGADTIRGREVIAAGALTGFVIGVVVAGSTYIDEFHK